MNVHPLRRRLAAKCMRLLFGDRTTVESARASLPTRGVFRILIVRVSHSLGNTLMMTPLIREIEATYPGAEIELVTRSQVGKDVFGSFPSVARIHQLPGWGLSHPWQILGMLRRIRRNRYDLVIDPSPTSQTDRLMALWARGRFTLGFANEKKAGSISHAVPLPTTTRHIGQLPIVLLRHACGSATIGAFPTIDLALTRAEREQGAATLSRLVGNTGQMKGVIGIFANASGNKFLGGTWWKRFVDVLEPRFEGYSFVEIVPASGVSLLESRHPAYYSGDIRKLCGVLSALTMYISCDCGVMHLASASGTPTVGIFTATDPAEWGPYGTRDQVIRAFELTAEQAAQQVGDQT